MIKEEAKMWASDKTIAEIIEKRDEFNIGSKEWEMWNDVKAERLEEIKPSTKEEILYFNEEDLKDIKEGFTKIDKIPNIKAYVGPRSKLEYHPLKRHPIPYVLVKYEDKYFFILREKGSGEMRLIGKIGLLGGHVSVEEEKTDLEENIISGLMRELEEEANITSEIIKSCTLKGIIKLNTGVDADHLGFVYEVELLTDNIKSHEEDKLTGIWINKSELKNYEDSFENWAKLVYEKLLR